MFAQAINLTTVSRTIREDQLVEELVLSLNHDRMVHWRLGRQFDGSRMKGQHGRGRWNVECDLKKDPGTPGVPNWNSFSRSGPSNSQLVEVFVIALVWELDASLMLWEVILNPKDRIERRIGRA